MTTDEMVCPHCQARNRRPKCGSCHEEIPATSDPLLVKWARKIHENQRNALRWLLFGLAGTTVVLVAWHPWETTLAECRGDAARSGRSIQAMHVLLDICEEKFRK